VVAIAAVALQFSLESHERRTVGILASERGIQRGAALGALALTQAKLEYALRVAPVGASVQMLRSSDPWLDVDTMYSGPVFVDSMEVDVQARDLGERLNINQLTEGEIQTFFSFLLGDYTKSTELAQAILDWRDADSIPRPNGAERDGYIKAKMLALPTNGPFREIEELSNVMGMTPEIYAKVVPYLTTHGAGLVNINTAPIPVLRALPGMTDATINMIVQQRSQGRRINSISDIVSSGRRLAGLLSAVQLQTAIGGRVVYQTTEVELSITSRVGPQAPPSRLTAILRRGSPVSVTFKEW
ncbi:MAG: general secretion pathway protein GspK, partial [Gemmatimonadaceae bacterium]